MITALDSECRFILNTESKEEAKAKAQAAEEEPTLLYQAPTEPISADSEVFVTSSNTSSPSTSPSIPSAVAAMLKKYDLLLAETQEYIKAKRVSVTFYPEIIMSNFFGIACCNPSHNVNSRVCRLLDMAGTKERRNSGSECRDCVGVDML